MTDPTPSPAPRQDVRRTSAEKLEKLREYADDMAREAARDASADRVAIWSVRIHKVLDGDF